MHGKLSDEFYNWLVELRRWFHRFPEPAYKEVKTAAKICETLDALNVPFHAGVGGTGVVARLRAKCPGTLIAYRADMDALTLEEKNNVPYKSRHQGVMHACGHDGHMTIALGVIRWLIENQWLQKGCGEIVFIFQPAEEGGAGAKAMLQSGIFDGVPIKAVFAGHMYPELPMGHIRLAPEISNAAADSIFIRLKGKGGHGAWELAARMSKIDLEDSGVEGGEETNVTLGVNWYATPSIRFMLNYVDVIDQKQEGKRDEPSLVEMRAQVDF